MLELHAGGVGVGMMSHHTLRLRVSRPIRISRLTRFVVRVSRSTESSAPAFRLGAGTGEEFTAPLVPRGPRPPSSHFPSMLLFQSEMKAYH